MTPRSLVRQCLRDGPRTQFEIQQFLASAGCHVVVGPLLSEMRRSGDVDKAWVPELRAVAWRLL